MPEEFIAELKLHEQQVAARNEARFNYAQANPDQIYALVSVKGKVVATVYESGIASLPRAAYSANLTDLWRAMDWDLARSRMGAGGASTALESAAASGTGA